MFFGELDQRHQSGPEVISIIKKVNSTVTIVRNVGSPFHTLLV